MRYVFPVMKQLFVLSVFTVFLVIVCSCPDGGFNCTSGECVAAQLVCDFKEDCKDGSDEEFCGSCDFERHTCGWNDTSLLWKRQMVNMTSVPGQDHTTGTSLGHVMHRDAADGGYTANLEYSVDKLAALGCQISFWYYFHDDDPFSLPNLKVEMVRGNTKTQLLEILDSEIGIWENATIFIGNQPGGYKLLFSGRSSPFTHKHIMLDDIKFDNCGEGDVPPGSDQLSCDFEKDTCSWYHDYTSSLLWKRIKGLFADQPIGNGYYMLIEASRKLNVSSAARLISFPRPAGQVICVSFWYHIFGNSIGSLKFITKHSDEPETVVWVRNGTQGNKWRFADLTFNSNKPIQFIIEAVVGGEQGTIAIDDIVVSSSVNGSCPPERECTFQGSLCGLEPQLSANFSWDRITGASQPVNSSGPTTDHTLKTEQGYYLSAQLWSHPVGSRGAMMTAMMEPTPADGECLMFWYYMKGSGVGELSVHLQTAGSHRHPQKLWHRSGDQGKHWRHGRVTLLSPDSQYQVIFEAVVGNEPWRDIAIDDLTVLNGACPPTGFCDFEFDLCGWVNNPPAESGVDWDWLSGSSEGKFIPSRDHTTNSALGHFAFILAAKPKRDEIARLESESMSAVDQACLELWHYSTAWSHDRPSSITLTVFVKDSAGLRPVWKTNGYTNDSWIQERVDYNAPELHQIILQASCANLTEASFSLDDVHMIRNKSCGDMIPSTTTAPTTTTAAPTSTMDCTFEQGLCNWIQEDIGDLKWTLSSGLQVGEPWDGPQYDHTTGNNHGFFLLLNRSTSVNSGRAVISVPVVNPPSHVCVGFWYFMLGPSVSSLDLLVQTKSSEVLVWTRRGTQNPEWINAQVTINMNDTIGILFTGHRTTTSQGFIAIDDITVREGVCSNQNMCGFESSLCDFENDVSHRGRWHRQKGTKDHVDHTYGTENGFFMTLLKTNSAQTEVAQLLSSQFTSAEELCVRFWYLLPKDSTNSLAVHLMRSGEVGNALWQSSGVASIDWEVAEVTVSSPPNFRVVFKAVQEPVSKSTVKLDDVSMRDGACSLPASCDFESGQCNWISIPKEDGHDWVLANGWFQGPPTDHTTQTPEGWFLLSSSLHLNHSSLAQIASEWIQLKDTASCLTLWYYMDSSDSGTLRVYKRSGPSEEELIFQSNSSERSWSRFSQTVEWIKPFQLLIKAETNNRGFIAIDDISLTPGFCQVNETSLSFVGCSFENGTCEWEDVSVGQCRWVRDRAVTGNTGPSIDHTLGTVLGWYMAVVSNRSEQISPAALQSPTMTQASVTCTLHFYYNMYGEDNEKLHVLLKEGSRSTPLWWLSGGSGDLWQHGEVMVGRIPQDFTILFEASRTFNKPGHVAIDDIDFTNCTLPEPQPLCPESMFMCNNSVCVERNQVCDFSDDCGDWSDENNCEQRGVVERCSFDQGLCAWTQSDVDTPGAEWTRHTGEEVWPKLGPPRDHTQNSAAGHYIIPSSGEIGQTSEILSKTLLPSLNCSVRFFYFSLNDGASRLSVQSRTLRSGGDDRLLWLRENSHSYSWKRVDVTFSSSANSKIVFRFEHEKGGRGIVALDDVSFSKECVFDPDNNELPDLLPTSTSPTSEATPSASTAPINPCRDNEFFCWGSAGKVCILATLQCNYHPDCPQGEDEDGCGPCTFENDQCQWTDVSEGQSKWQRQKASNDTEPPTDHTIHTGYYMRVNISHGSMQSEARLQSPSLPPSSSYCQIQFHFHIRTESAGSLRVLMQQADGSEAILWSRSHNTMSHWTAKSLLLGPHQQPYKVLFSSRSSTAQGDPTIGDHVFAVDDITFLNCEKSYQPPALSAYGCSFEDGLCIWVQGDEDELDWISRSGPTETLNTGPAGDHTTGKGKYLHMESSPPSVKGNMAQLKSSLLPPAGEKGYCLTFWYHMFGATVGSLKVLLQTAAPMKKTLVWQKSGDQGDEWLPMRIHVMLQKVHQVVLEATVGGEAGDIAIDDISLKSGPCPASDVCDFEEDSCSWQQQTHDDFDWIRQSGPTHHPNTGPDADHTTNASTGHYYYLPSSAADRVGQTAAMSSPLYPAGKGTCVQLWYHMYGQGVGTLNVYQQSEDEKKALIFSQSGDQRKLWRFAQASLLPQVQPFRIVVEGVKAGPSYEGDMAFDDVQLTDAQCPPPGFCDFEHNICSWSNLGMEIDEGDWLRGRGASPNPNTGPSVDHTTNSIHGYYLYVDSTVGQWGDTSFLVSDVFQPSPRGHCLTFWHHMYGSHVGTLRVYINDRKMHSSGSEEGALLWIKSGNMEDKWHMASVSVKHEEAFWFVFVYQRGMNTGGDVALDDITISPGSCYSEPPIDPPEDENSVGLIVGIVLVVILAGVVVYIFVITRGRKYCTKNQERIVTEDDPVYDLFDCTIAGTQHGAESDFIIINKLYEPSPNVTSTNGTSSEV